MRNIFIHNDVFAILDSFTGVVNTSPDLRIISLNILVYASDIIFGWNLERTSRYLNKCIAED